MIHLALGVDVLARTDHHILSRRDVNKRCFSRVVVRHPEGDGVAVGGAAEDSRDGTREVEEESRCAIREGYSRS